MDAVHSHLIARQCILQHRSTPRAFSPSSRNHGAHRRHAFRDRGCRQAAPQLRPSVASAITRLIAESATALAGIKARKKL
jgi:hypothetical protein